MLFLFRSIQNGFVFHVLRGFATVITILITVPITFIDKRISI